ANGTTALMAAAGVEMGNPNEDSGRDADALTALQVALQLGAGDINAADRRGDTALHGAIGRVSPLAAKFLVDNGARLDVRNKRGLVPMEVAMGETPVGGRRPDTAEMLGQMMVARGLTPPEMKDNTDRYRFGVKEAK